MPKGFGARHYQNWTVADDLCVFQVHVRESDLCILAEADFSELALQVLKQVRQQIEDYCAEHSEFYTSFEPIEVDPQAPLIIHKMASAARLAGVGPFASVAGAVAERVGEAILPYSREVIVENGGDIFVASQHNRIFGIYAGHSPLTGKIGLRVNAASMPCGVCTSSGSVGPSLSYGRTDAAIVIAKSTILADACATALGNVVKCAGDIAQGMNIVKDIQGVEGGVVIVGSEIGAWGDVEFVHTTHLG